MKRKWNNTPDLPISAWEHIIDEWIFSERDRRLVKRYLLDNISFEPLSEEFGLSVRQTKNIVYKSENIIYKHCL